MIGGTLVGVLMHDQQRKWIYTVEPADVRLTAKTTATIQSAARYWLYFGATLAASPGQKPDACNWLQGRPDPTALLGRITSLPTAPGLHVKAGATLATADEGPALGALETARQSLRNAQLLLSRDQAAAQTAAADQVPASVTPPSNSPTAAAALQFSADAQLGVDEDRVTRASRAQTGAQQALTAAELKAPVDGVIEQVATALGSLPSCHSAALVMRSDSLTVHTEIPETVLPYLSVGQAAVVTVPVTQNSVRTTVSALPVQAVPGQESANHLSGTTYPLDLALPYPVAGLLPGMPATTIFSIATTGLAVPSAAILHRTDSGSATVLVCPAGSHGCQGAGPVPTPVTLGLVGDTLTQITAGLSRGDAVVVPGSPSDTATATPQAPNRN